MVIGVEDLEPEDDRKFTVTRPSAASTGYSPSGPGGVSLTPTGPGLSGGAIDVAFQNFIATGVVPSDAVLGYETGVRGPLTVQALYEAGMRDISIDDLMMIATKGPEILDRDLRLRVNLAARYDKPIRRAELVNQLPERNLEYLAMDMFLNVDGAYRDIDEVFDDDGMLNMQQFNYALEQTFKQAMIAGPSGFGTTTEFLDILTQNRDLSVEELQALFDEREAELEETGSGVVLFDPVGLKAVAKDAFVSPTGRRGTKAEQQKFVRLVHKLQLSGQRSIDVGARAEEFAREVAPVEAAAMDEATAGSILMDVIRSRR